jgi:hypothetical protein
MRASTAYFAGAGTVMAAIVAGVGGGLLFANMITPKAPKTEMTRLEQRMTTQPIQAAAAPSETVKNAAPAQAAAPNESPAPTQVQPTQVQASTAPANPANPVPPTAPPVTSATAVQAAPAAPPPAAAAPVTRPVVAATQPAPQEPRAAPASEDTTGKARDADVKRTVEKRKVDRRQQWTEKRRYRSNRDQELIAVEDSVREETEPRRTLAAEPVRTEMPLIRLFGSE